MALAAAAAPQWHRRVAPAANRHYITCMSLYLSRLARYAAQRIALDPRARGTALTVARSVVNEAKVVARDEDPARAAGRAVRRALNGWQSQEPRDITPSDKLEGPRDGG